MKNLYLNHLSVSQNSLIVHMVHGHKDTNLQARLGEQVFVQNNTMWKGLGFSPHQMVLGLSSGVPGVYDVPEGNNDTHFVRSLNRIKEGLA